MDQLHSLRSGMEQSLTTTQGHLSKLHSDITQTLEKVYSREKYINHQLEQPLTEYRNLQVTL